jgi:ubiquinone/menaquinone biosynthesis C-methylase UbiE
VRIEKLGGHMTRHPEGTTVRSEDVKAAVRAMWALGDYHRFATQTVWEVGPVVVEACGITAGERVLDVAAGTGNVAIRAAEAGAHVVASDLTPENFAAGRREARARGIELEWVEADAEALPFDDAAFDVVTSSFGAIFAPDHQAVADEMLRVCRPDGRIGMANFVPEGPAVAFFDALAAYMPPQPGAESPLSWGDDSHVRAVFGDRLESLELTRRTYVERSASPDEYAELFRTTFGPIVAMRESITDRAARAELDRELVEFAYRFDRGAPGGPAEYPYDYLLVVAVKR